MPITIVPFLYDDIRPVLGTKNFFVLVANNMFEDDIQKYHTF